MIPHRHPLNQSALYKLTSPLQLAKRLQWDVDELEKLANRVDNYTCFPTGKAKKRDVQKPKRRTQALHKRIAIWLLSIPIENGTFLPIENCTL